MKEAIRLQKEAFRALLAQEFAEAPDGYQLARGAVQDSSAHMCQMYV